MTMKTSLLGQVGLGVLSFCLLSSEAHAKPRHHTHHAQAPAASAEAQALQQQVEALKQQVESLQAWHDSEAGRSQDLSAQVTDLKQQLAQAQTQAQAAQTQAQEQIQTIPGVVHDQIAAAQPKDGKLHYKGISLTLGGFVAAEGIYRSKNELADISSQFAKLPFDNTPLGHTNELRGTARQSRVSFLAEGDVNQSTHLAMYGEFDFQAGAQTGNSNESNSYSPRIRHLYGTVDWADPGLGGGLHLLAGQTWSLTTMNSKGITPRNEVTPPTIDAQYVPGFTWAPPTPDPRDGRLRRKAGLGRRLGREPTDHFRQRGHRHDRHLGQWPDGHRQRRPDVGLRQRQYPVAQPGPGRGRQAGL